jgi:hypothetical protein
MGEEEDPKAKKDEESGVCSALAAWHAAAGAPRLPCRRLHQRGAAADGSPSPLGSQPVRNLGPQINPCSAHTSVPACAFAIARIALHRVPA